MVLIDQMSLEFMGGAEIDYVDDLIGASFQIKNPECGRLLRLRHEFRRLVSRHVCGMLAPGASRR